jgi:hypothetical protein
MIATRVGRTPTLSFDPSPDSSEYMTVLSPGGMIVLIPKESMLAGPFSRRSRDPGAFEWRVREGRSLVAIHDGSAKTQEPYWFVILDSTDVPVLKIVIAAQSDVAYR